MSHTIILIQYTNQYNSRGYLDFPDVGSAMDGLVKMYELKLKELNPNLSNITYDIQNLYDFLDTLTDLVALVFDKKVEKYDPKDNKWIKDNIMTHLRNQAV